MPLSATCLQLHTQKVKKQKPSDTWKKQISTSCELGTDLNQPKTFPGQELSLAGAIQALWHQALTGATAALELIGFCCETALFPEAQ